MKFIAILTMTLAASFTASATGIPLINPGAPIKVSETNSYRCGADGKGYILDDGKLQPLIYSGVAVTCHDDNLWFEGRSLSFMDIVALDAKDITAAKEALSK
ncbi:MULTISPECIES: hypothetical protein [Enterobacterales]|jgi:hypothetical protein|uniref:hypothetical protein n=1 Tax=Enterobacterales TaxID=91347 RepID=UPI0005077E6E|nr:MULTISPECIES: hypothetical protein [Enterobacterales]EHL6328878.1 hypothetical protein [Escherichia coli]EIW8478609.1 hypothetical protein [Klebsiella pneumoniae]ELW4252684.1 hypothetical protein [Salmonella enterica]ELY2734947.1 hypothetical protein [Cronobacter sakazakii]EIR9204966.1 hypothetical protein [Escherichia coli]